MSGGGGGGTAWVKILGVGLALVATATGLEHAGIRVPIVTSARWRSAA